VNPALDSVDAGHYYQGKLGQTFFARLRTAGLLKASSGWEDDDAFTAGIGFTDIVKRPTRSESEISPDELQYGRSLLLEKLEAVRAELIIFTFKKTATVIFGRFDGFGFIGRTLAGGEVFVMPGPYERADRRDQALAELGQWWRNRDAH
jgi:TDG/mug DNA glycosylase family protein